MPLLTFDFAQIEFLLFVLSIAANAGLGIMIWKYASYNISRHIFFLFIVVQVLWISSSYIFTQTANIVTTSRITLFFASFHAFSFYLFIYTLHEKRDILRKKWVLIPAFFLLPVAGLTLTPLIIVDTWQNPDGTIGLIWGPARPIFASFAGLCVIGAFLTLFRKFRKARDLRKTQWRLIGIGIVATFSLIVSFSFLGPVLFENVNMVRFSHLYTLPFVFFASYAILKHHFLNIKVFATELFAFLIVGISIAQITFARNFTEFVFSAVLLVLLIIFSALLIRNMNREVQHRVQEAAYEELQKLDAAKGEFITIASHQLRTPLSGLKGYISMAQEGSYGKLPKSMEETLGKMAIATDRLISLADSFLNVSRIHKQASDIAPFLKNIIQEIKPRAEEKGLPIQWNPPAKTLPKVSIDQEKIRTVLLGILDNAIRYTEKGSIEVKLIAQNPKSKNGGVVVAVKDTGKGLTKDEVENIFVSFKRGKTAQALWTEGVGLSLYTAKQFVEAHDGKIWAESPGEGKGSTFYIELALS